MRTNYHTHTYRCKHAVGAEEDYIIEAIKNNLSEIGLSDHAPYPFDGFENRMEYCELSDYLFESFRVKAKYKDKISVKIGLEIEYIESEHAYYEKLKNELSVEYLVLGQHFFDMEGELMNTFDLKSSHETLYYAKTIEKALETPYFAFLAHPDVIFINDIEFDENSKKACEIIINAAKKHDAILEFNANGVRRGLREYSDGTRYPYPYMKFWEMVAKENLRVIISSDCHNPNDLWDESVEKSYELAKELSLNIIYSI